MIWWVVPVVPPMAKGQSFDAVGALGLAAGLVALILPISQGARWGWGSPVTLSLFIGAAVILALWGLWETRARDPLVDLRATTRPRVLLTNIASIFIGFAMYASMLVMPQVLQLSSATGYGLGQSVLAAGLWMAPAGLMMLALAPVGGRLSDRRGPKVTLVLGVFILAIGYGVALLGMGTTWGLLITGLVINGGVALAYGAMPALIMSAVPRSETAAANGFNTLMRSLGTTSGAAVIGAGASLVAAAIAACIPSYRPSGRDDEGAPRKRELIRAG